MVEFANQAFLDRSSSRYKDRVTAEIQESERIKQILTNLNKRYKILKIGQDDVRIRVAIPKRIRDIAGSLIGMTPEDYDEMGGMVGVTDTLYEVAAEMCLDPPYNDPATWYYLDENSDGVMLLIREILDAAEDTEAEVYNFR